MPKRTVPMLAETEFWKTKGKDLLLSTRSIDPETTLITSNHRIRVACEHCGKEMNRKLRRWCNGETLCWDCKPKYLAEQEAAKQAEAKRNFGKGTLWDVLSWHVILMWDWKKNEVAPWEVRAQSRQVVHLVCDKCGYEIGKEARFFTRHFMRDSERQGTERKSYTSICDCCSERVLVRGVNDLATTHPDVAAHWHPTKNGKLTPKDVTSHSRLRVWWVYDNGIEGTAKIIVKAHVNSNFSKAGPMNTQSEWKPVSKTHPHLVPQWDIAKNNGLSPDDFTYGSAQKILWTCPGCGYEWSAQIKSRAISGTGCPRCAKTGTSKGEDLVIRALEMLGMRYEVEKRFDSCRHKAPLPFDFAGLDEVGEVLFLIEYQGRQHDEPIEMWGGEEGLKTRQKCDQIKRDWCKLHGIPLLEICHTIDDIDGVLWAIANFSARLVTTRVA